MKPITFAVIATSILVLGACSEQITRQSIERNAVIASLNLTPDEQNIWKTLTREQQDRAILFIQNGGTLIASLGDK